MPRFEMKTAAANDTQVFIYGNVRLTVISDRILRIEKSPDGVFCDKATQAVVCRDFCHTSVKVNEEHGFVTLVTDKGAFRVNLGTLKGEARIGRKWVLPSNKTNLGGTARTLDGTFGVLGSWKTKKEKRDRFGLGHMRKGIFA